MKHLALTTLLTIISSLAFANGGGGGGGWRPGTFAMTSNFNSDTGELSSNESQARSEKPRDIVFSLGQRNGIVHFAYGRLINTKWQIQNLEATQSDLDLSPDFSEALNASKFSNKWIYVDAK